jgi:CheY-like chemotaxis protein
MPASILVVEDDVDVRDVMEEYLTSRGYEVIPAANGKQALDFLFSSDPRSPPDLVVLDLMMPLVTGWQVLQAMRGDRRLAAIPVVVVTAVAGDRPVKVKALLSKPFNVESLERIVSQTLRNAGVTPEQAG